MLRMESAGRPTRGRPHYMGRLIGAEPGLDWHDAATCKQYICILYVLGRLHFVVFCGEAYGKRLCARRRQYVETEMNDQLLSDYL